MVFRLYTNSFHIILCIVYRLVHQRYFIYMRLCRFVGFDYERKTIVGGKYENPKNEFARLQ